MAKVVFLSILSVLISVQSALAIDSEPILSKKDTAAVDTDPVLRTYDINNGAEVSFKMTEKGTMVLMLEGKALAELAPDSMRPSAEGKSLNFADKDSFLSIYYVEWTY